jgi:hypothetical protein
LTEPAGLEEDTSLPIESVRRPTRSLWGGGVEAKKQAAGLHGSAAPTKLG